MSTLDPLRARQIIQQLGDSGQPPEYGVQYFTVGLDPFLNVLKDEYLATFIQSGGSNFKLVVGNYGGGKTHFLYCVRNLAWEHGFAASYVSLKSGGECPFDRLELVYKALVNGPLPPVVDPGTRLRDVQRIENFLRDWYARRIAHHRDLGKSVDVTRGAVAAEIDALDATSIHSISFRNAVVQALRAVASGNDTLYSAICQWLKGEYTSPTPQLKKLEISQKIDRTTAFSLIRSLAQTMRHLEYKGFVVLFDEAEQVPSMGRRQRDQLLSNLREFIDECSQSSFEGMMVFYAVPDLNFLNGSTGVYQALNQRLQTVFRSPNYMGVRIELDNSVQEPASFLRDVGARIEPIYEAAYGVSLDPRLTEPLIATLADSVSRQRYMDAGYRRPFVQRLVQGLGIVRAEQRLPTLEELS